MVPVAPVMPMMRRIRGSGLSAPGSSLLSCIPAADLGPNTRPEPRAESREPRADEPRAESREPRDHISSSPVLKRQTSGSVICTSCGVLVGVNDETCYNCGRRNPSLWGFAPALRGLGTDLGFVPFLTGTCVVLYGLSLLMSGGNIGMNGLFGLLAPNNLALRLLGESGAGPDFSRRVVVDGAERGMAAWQRPAHPVQHDVGAATRPGDG